MTLKAISSWLSPLFVSRKCQFEYPAMYRFVLVLTSYLLSSLGLLFMFQLISEELRKPYSKPLDLIVLLVWLLAWCCHLAMSIAWVNRKRLGRVFAGVGTLMGVASFLVWPVLNANSPTPAFMAEAATAATFSLMKAQLLLISPSLLLAIFLVRFHWSTSSSCVDRTA